MKRFYFDDEEHDEDEDDLEDMEKFMFPGPSDFITMGQFENADNFLLSSSIKICEKSFFWRFFNISKKIRMIEQVFESLVKITEGQNDAEI